MQNVGLLLTITGSLSAALLAGLVAQRLRLSPIVGYLLAGGGRDEGSAKR